MIYVRNSAKKLHISLLVTLVVTNKASTCWNSSFRNGACVSQLLRKEIWVLLRCLLFPFHISFSEINLRDKKKILKNDKSNLVRVLGIDLLNGPLTVLTFSPTDPTSMAFSHYKDGAKGST